MTRTLRTVALLSVSAAALGACGGGGGGSVTATPTPTPTPSANVAIQDRVGATFATTFNASANTEPRDPAATDVPATNLTAEPIDG